MKMGTTSTLMIMIAMKMLMTLITIIIKAIRIIKVSGKKKKINSKGTIEPPLHR